MVESMEMEKPVAKIVLRAYPVEDSRVERTGLFWIAAPRPEDDGYTTYKPRPDASVKKVSTDVKPLPGCAAASDPPPRHHPSRSTLPQKWCSALASNALGSCERAFAGTNTWSMTIRSTL